MNEKKSRTRPAAASLSLVLAVALAFPAAAQDVREPVKKVLSLEECVEMGLKTSKALHASEARVEASTARSKEVNASRLPSLKLSGGYTRLSEVPPFEVHLPFPSGLTVPSTFVVSPNYFDNYSVRMGLQQPLFTGFRLQSSAAMARLGAQAAVEDLAGDRNQVIFAVKNAYWNLFKAGEFKKVVDESAAQVEAHLADVRNFFEQGLLTRNEVLKAEVQLSNVKLARLDAANGVEMAAVWLNSLIGAQLDDPIEPAATIEELEAGARKMPGGRGGLDGLVDKALGGRPELRAMDLRVKAGEAGVTLARSGWFPQVILTGNYYDLRPNPRLMPAKDRFYSTWDLGVSVSMDLWNWNATLRQTQQAKALLAQALDVLGQLRDAAAVEVRQSWLALKSAREKIDVAGVAVAQADENLRVTNERFKEGVALNSEVLDAETALLQAKTGHTQALVDLELAKAGLAKAVGE
jgi:outer membrane protein TolC